VKSRISAFIFDYDGTLADSALTVLPVYNAIAPGLGLPLVTEADFPRLRRLGPKGAIQAYRVPLWKVPLLLAQVRHELEQRKIVPALYPGLSTVFDSEVMRKARRFILSSNSRANIDRFLAHHSLGTFERIDCGSSLFGKARRLRRLLKEVGLRPSEVAYVGDESRDLEAAREVGAMGIAVSWGYADRETLMASRPDFLVDDPAQLGQIMAQVSGNGGFGGP
jgi:phosphoglycolate phosphatase-like HAD superfamily hydrolase